MRITPREITRRVAVEGSAAAICALFAFAGVAKVSMLSEFARLVFSRWINLNFGLALSSLIAAVEIVIGLGIFLTSGATRVRVAFAGLALIAIYSIWLWLRPSDVPCPCFGIIKAGASANWLNEFPQTRNAVIAGLCLLVIAFELPRTGTSTTSHDSRLSR